MANDFFREITAEVRERTGAMLGKVLFAVQDPSPVKTHRFVGSWEPYHLIPPQDEGQPDGMPFYPLRGQDDVDRVMAGFQLGDEVGLVNQVPYAQFLANGGSRQAEAGWVDVAVEGALSA